MVINIFLLFCKIVASSALPKNVIEGHHTIIKSNGEKAFPKRKTLRTLTLAKNFLLEVNSIWQFFIVSVMNFKTLSDILYNF